VDDAENEVERCLRDNTHGAAVLAIACIRHKLQLLTYSSDLVFDGKKGTPYVESDAVSPLNVYGKSKGEAERRVLTAYPDALVIRTSAFFGPWDKHNFVTQALNALADGGSFMAASDMTVSPTYVPDLVHASLDLLIDKESGIWHLTNTGPLTWYDLARRACELANVDTGRLEARSCSALGYPAVRPVYSALSSERAILLPALDDALSRYLRLRQDAAEEDDAGQAAHVGNN
jgi:dTDP-4-dehydrorhamnose reductase